MIVSQPDRVLLLRQMEKYAAKLTGDLLDVGGGSGKRYRGMFTNAKKYRSLDLNPDMHPDIVGSAEAIPLGDGTVDSVLSTQMLEHVPHPWKVLSEIRRVLKPSGIALITVPQLNEVHEAPLDFYRYTCFGMKVLCEEAGFEILDINQRGGYHCCMAQTRIRRWIDKLRPYERPLFLWLLAPWSMLYTNYAIWRDRLDTSEASRRHAIGWALLLKKPS